MQRRCLILLSTLLLIVGFLFAQDLPQPVGWVNDFANVISAEHKEKLTRLIQELEEKTSAEIAVVTINSIAPYGEIEYARMLFDNWKPGKKGKDNGVLVFLAIKERRWRIETGYGIEGILPDGLCGEIGRNYMVPYFKEGNYGQGLYSGVVAIAGVLVKDAHVQIAGLKEAKKPKSDFGFLIFLFLVSLFVTFLGNYAYFMIGIFLIWMILGIGFGFEKFFTFPGLVGAFVILGLLRLIFRRCSKNLPDKKREYWGLGGGYGGGWGGGGFGGGGFGGGGGGGGGGAGGGF